MTEFLRQSEHVYQDPVAEIWISCAKNLGFKVVRSKETYASTDGLGTLFIATDDQLDSDDHLGQMIFHELCHALVEGEDGERRVDWGLDNTRMGNPWREHAALRLQAYLAEGFGLRDLMAPTTDFRVSFWSGLSEDPFWVPESEGGRCEKSVMAARKAFCRSERPRWREVLEEALEATAQIGALVRRVRTPFSRAPDHSLTLPPLWGTVRDPLPRHPAGHEVIRNSSKETCSDCAWQFESRGYLRCRYRPSPRLFPETPACRRFEFQEDLACQTCGACCREAFDSVEISRRDPIHKTHPDLIERFPTHHKLRRSGERCIALEGGRQPGDPYWCSIYADRPGTCRDFARGSSNCLEARQRVGMSL